MEYNLPKDAAMLLSFVNTKLRDNYDSLEEFCAAQNVSDEKIRATLDTLDYVYDRDRNQFV